MRSSRTAVVDIVSAFHVMRALVSTFFSARSSWPRITVTVSHNHTNPGPRARACGTAKGVFHHRRYQVVRCVHAFANQASIALVGCGKCGLAQVREVLHERSGIMRRLQELHHIGQPNYGQDSLGHPGCLLGQPLCYQWRMILGKQRSLAQLCYSNQSMVDSPLRRLVAKRTNSGVRQWRYS